MTRWIGIATIVGTMALFGCGDDDTTLPRGDSGVRADTGSTTDLAPKADTGAAKDGSAADTTGSDATGGDATGSDAVAMTTVCISKVTVTKNGTDEWDQLAVGNAVRPDLRVKVAVGSDESKLSEERSDIFDGVWSPADCLLDVPTADLLASTLKVTVVDQDVGTVDTIGICELTVANADLQAGTLSASDCDADNHVTTLELKLQ